MTASGDIIPVAEQLRYAQALAESNLLPPAFRGRPANVVVALGYGEMLHVPPMAALTGIAVIDGKPALSAALMAALVRRAGHSLRIDTDSDGVTATIVRSDDPDFTYTARWDQARAVQAGLADKDNYVHHPTPMWTARAITEVTRQACQDVIYGLHSPEELGAEVIVDDQGELVPVPDVDDLAACGATPARPQSTADGAPEPAADDQRADQDANHRGERADEQSASARTLAKIAILCGESGLTAKEERLAFASRAVGRRLTSSLELTQSEASRLIERLEEYRDEYRQMIARQEGRASADQGTERVDPGDQSPVPGW